MSCIIVDHLVKESISRDFSTAELEQATNVSNTLAFWTAWDVLNSRWGTEYFFLFFQSSQMARVISCSHDKQGTWRKVDNRCRVDWVRIRVSLGLRLVLLLGRIRGVRDPRWIASSAHHHTEMRISTTQDMCGRRTHALSCASNGHAWWRSTIKIIARM